MVPFAVTGPNGVENITALLLRLSDRLGCIDIFTFPNAAYLLQLEDGRRSI